MSTHKTFLLFLFIVLYFNRIISQFTYEVEIDCDANDTINLNDFNQKINNFSYHQKSHVIVQCCSKLIPLIELIKMLRSANQTIINLEVRSHYRSVCHLKSTHLRGISENGIERLAVNVDKFENIDVFRYVSKLQNLSVSVLRAENIPDLSYLHKLESLSVDIALNGKGLQNGKNLLLYGNQNCTKK